MVYGAESRKKCEPGCEPETKYCMIHTFGNNM